jgi:hypothetical protein
MIVCSSANLRARKFRGARHHHDVHVGRVGFERKFRQASRALDVVAINGEAVVFLIFHNFSASVDHVAHVNMFAARVAFHVEWKHERESELPVLGLGLGGLNRRGRIEIRPTVYLCKTNDDNTVRAPTS